MVEHVTMVEPITMVEQSGSFVTHSKVETNDIPELRLNRRNYS